MQNSTELKRTLQGRDDRSCGIDLASLIIVLISAVDTLAVLPPNLVTTSVTPEALHTPHCVDVCIVTFNACRPSGQPHHAGPIDR
jgi:hypothetical protein